jgi:hypothetical protein
MVLDCSFFVLTLSLSVVKLQVINYRDFRKLVNANDETPDTDSDGSDSSPQQPITPPDNFVQELMQDVQQKKDTIDFLLNQFMLYDQATKATIQLLIDKGFDISTIPYHFPSLDVVFAHVRATLGNIDSAHSSSLFRTTNTNFSKFWFDHNCCYHSTHNQRPNTCRYSNKQRLPRKEGTHCLPSTCHQFSQSYKFSYGHVWR